MGTLTEGGWRQFPALQLYFDDHCYLSNDLVINESHKRPIMNEQVVVIVMAE